MNPLTEDNLAVNQDKEEQVPSEACYSYKYTIISSHTAIGYILNSFNKPIDLRFCSPYASVISCSRFYTRVILPLTKKSTWCPDLPPLLQGIGSVVTGATPNRKRYLGLSYTSPRRYV